MNKQIIWVKAQCLDYYHFLKKVQYINIAILDIRYKDEVIYLKINREDFTRLNKYLISYKFKKIGNTGINLLIDKVKNNWVFSVAFIIGVGIFLVVQNLIFEVNIIHEDKEIREIISDELDTYGISVLRFKKSYRELNEIRQKILDKYPDKLDWMEFESNGLVFNVRVEERIITDITKDNKACDVVSLKSGIINDILVYSGEALVMINDYVREGDTLITGIIKHNEEEKGRVCASGNVYATTWYTASVSIPLKHDEITYTGAKKYNFVWENDGNKKNILRKRFQDYESKYQTIFEIFNYKLYLETELETKKVTKTYMEEEALEEGINKALESIKIKLSENDTIIDKKVLKKSINDSTMDMEVFIIVKELISTEKEITLEDVGEGTD